MRSLAFDGPEALGSIALGKKPSASGGRLRVRWFEFGPSELWSHYVR